jgi:hypothetical protein
MKNLLIICAVAFLFSACGKKESSLPPISTFPYYFSANINGSVVKYEADDHSRYDCDISQPTNGLYPSDYDIYEGTMILDQQDLGRNSIGVHILKYYDHYPSTEEKTSMIHLGSYAYGYGNVSSNTINGASITYLDDSGNMWSSELGPQTGSSFNITELVNNPDGTSAEIFRASFSCKLYDGMGASIQVTGGVIRGKVLSP